MNKIVFCDLTVNLDEKLCYIKESPLKLTKSEYNILNFFLKNRNKIFSREELMNVAWESKVTDRAVNTAMSRLKSKIKPYDKNFVTRNGFGYGFFEKV